MSFKIGDKVRTKRGNKNIYDGDRDQQLSYMDEMIKDEGKIATITKKCPFCVAGWELNLGPYGYYWHENWLELIPNKILIKDFLNA